MTFFRRLFICLVLGIATIASSAQTEASKTSGTTDLTADTLNIVQRIEAPGNISISLPDGLLKRLEKSQDSALPAEGEDAEKTADKAQTKNTSRVGYRVQVFDDNNVRTAKHDAQNRKRQMENRFPEFRTYMQFNSPYWRVKVGDFRTRSEADAALAAIRAAFPSLGGQMRVVRDHINPQH